MTTWLVIALTVIRMVHRKTVCTGLQGTVKARSAPHRMGGGPFVFKGLYGLVRLACAPGGHGHL